MFYNFENLTDEEIVSKIDTISKKLNSAYNTSINEQYLISLENALSQLYSIQEERDFIENSAGGKNKSGVVMETDPELSNSETLIPKKQGNTPKEVTPKKEFIKPEIKKVYKK